MRKPVQKLIGLSLIFIVLVAVMFSVASTLREEAQNANSKAAKTEKQKEAAAASLRGGDFVPSAQQNWIAP